ncbi:MAG: chromate resistance protein [Thermoprotei archaeon]|nr:MAG: chromate resistance protein [Thermoprotei archaeon]
MKWVTRAFPHVDRTASAWLIKRFIDPNAEFVLINWPEEELKPEHDIPFDIKGVELGHKDNKCTFEVIVEKYSIKDPYVLKIAEIVHAADIEGEIDKVPEARGIKAVFNGLRFITKDDYETLELGMKIWDAIYASLKLKDIQERYKDELKSMTRTERLRFLKKVLRE